MDFRQSWFIFTLGGAMAAFIIAQSLFFLIRAWKRGREIGVDSAALRTTVASSVLFTIAPSMAIATTVLALSNSLGFALPWLRMNVIGSFIYEVTAATAAMDAMGHTGGLGAPVTDPATFSGIAWMLTIGCILPLILLPFVLKKIQTKINKSANTNAKWTDMMSAAAFVGLMAAFVARAVAGKGEADKAADGAGVLSVLTLLTAIAVLLLLEWLVQKKNWKGAQPFIMPASMFAAMGAAVLFAYILPDHLASFVWR